MGTVIGWIAQLLGIKGKDGTNIASTSNPVPVEVQGTITLPGEVEVKNDTGNPVPVTSTNLDIRDLVFATDKVDVTGSSVSVSNFPATQPVSATSLPLPTGAATLAEQQTQSISLSVIDDWDESDRAKVNPIAGQTGVEGGTGVNTAKTQRVSLATDVPLPAGTNEIGVIQGRYTAVADANNTNAAGGTVIPAYLGVKFLDEAILASYVGAALPVAPADTFLGTAWTSAKDYSAFSLVASSTRLGQGYAIWSRDGGSTVSRIETTPFFGAGAFTDPPQGDTHFRIAFQNRDATGTNTFRIHTQLHYQAQSLFQFPIAAPIHGSLPAALVRSVVTGQQPDSDYENVRVAGSDPGNSTSNLLGAGASFTGTGFDATGFISVVVIVRASHASATEGIKIQFSNDSFTTILKEHQFTYSANDLGEGRIYSVPANQGEEYRITYTNGSTAQTSFSLRTELSTSIVQPLTDDVGRGTVLVSPGLRISQVFKRTRQEVNKIAQTVSATLYTVPIGKIYYVTSVSIAAESSNTTSAVTGRFRDGGAGGTMKFSFKINEATGGLGGINETVNVGQTFDEPLEFATDIYYEEVMDGVTADILFVGYLEDI